MKISLLVGLAAFAGLAQASLIDPTLLYPSGDVIIQATMTGYVTGVSFVGPEYSLWGLDITIGDPIAINFWWDLTAIENTTNSGIYLDGFNGNNTIVSWGQDDEDPSYYQSQPVASQTEIAGYSFLSNGYYSDINYYPGGGNCVTPFIPFCFTFEADNYGGNEGMWFSAANSNGVTSSDLSSQANLNAYLSDPGDTYTLFYSTAGGNTAGMYLTANLSLEASTPEPASWILLALGLGAGALLKLRRRTV